MKVDEPVKCMAHQEETVVTAISRAMAFSQSSEAYRTITASRPATRRPSRPRPSQYSGTTDDAVPCFPVTLEVKGAPTYLDAKKVAEAVSKSALVKASWNGNDPNWGRIV